MGVKVKEWKGTWWIFVQHQGKRKAKRVGEGKEGHRAALAAAETLQARLVLGGYNLDEPKPVTLRNYAEVRLNTSVSTNLKAGTREKYAEILRKHWFPKLGDTPIQRVSRAQTRTILSEKLSSHAHSTVTLMIDVLRGCLNAAVEDQLRTGNPAAKRGKVLPQGRKKEKIEIFAPGTLSFLLTTAELKTPEIYPQILLLARNSLTGQNGENLLYNCNQLGHSSIRITVDTYGHLIPSANKAAVDRLEEGLTTRRNLYATKMKMRSGKP
jgi:integrase